MIARDFKKWKRDVLTALCPSRDDEDEFEGVRVPAPYMTKLTLLPRHNHCFCS